MSSKKILFAEAEGEFREQLGDRLKSEGYKVDSVCSTGEAKELLKYKRYCLYIVGMGLPDDSGLELCELIRQISKNPLLCIVDNNAEAIIKCYRLGADVCIGKHYNMKVILEGVKALLRRSVNEEKTASYIYKTGNLIFDIDCREVYCRDKKIQLTKGEFNLLSIMMQSGGRVIDRNTMLDVMGGTDAAVCEDNALSVRISRLRDKLKREDGEKYFITVRGVGYRWIKPVEKELKKC